MNWQSILWNLLDARGVLSELLSRERPLGRQELYMSMHYVGKHLNRAWKGRHASAETTARRERQDISRWERFPAHPIFNDLRPAPPPLRRTCRFPADTPIDAEPAHACLQRAYRELERLCELANEAFDASRNTVAASLDEKEFGHSLHQIYGQLALAWNNSFRANFDHSSKNQGVRRTSWAFAGTTCQGIS